MMGTEEGESNERDEPGKKERTLDTHSLPKVCQEKTDLHENFAKMRTSPAL